MLGLARAHHQGRSPFGLLSRAVGTILPTAASSSTHLLQ